MPKAPPPAVAKLRASIAGNESWARTPDRAARTAPARQARWQKYLDRAKELAGPAATDQDIEQRAHHLYKADMKRAALASIKARKAKGGDGAAARDRARAALRRLATIDDCPDTELAALVCDAIAELRAAESDCPLSDNGQTDSSDSTFWGDA